MTSNTIIPRAAPSAVEMSAQREAFISGGTEESAGMSELRALLHDASLAASASAAPAAEPDGPDRLSNLPEPIRDMIADYLRPVAVGNWAATHMEAHAHLKQRLPQSSAEPSRWQPLSARNGEEVSEALNELRVLPLSGLHYEGKVAQGLLALANGLPHLPEDDQLQAFSDILVQNQRLLGSTSGSGGRVSDALSRHIPNLPAALRLPALLAMQPTLIEAYGLRDPVIRPTTVIVYCASVNIGLHSLPPDELRGAVRKIVDIMPPSAKSQIEIRLTHTWLESLPPHQFQLAYQSTLEQAGRGPEAHAWVVEFSNKLRFFPSNDARSRIAFRALAQTAAKLKSPTHAAAVLENLAELFKAQPAGEAYLAGMDLLNAAQTLPRKLGLGVLERLKKNAFSVMNQETAFLLSRKCSEAMRKM